MDWLPGSNAGTPGSEMGHFRVGVEIAHLTGERFVPVEALVDTGATFTWIPLDVLEGLGVEPQDERPFVLADGREVRYPVAWIKIGLGRRVQPTIVVFGEPGAEPILGCVTLEEFLLAADPVHRRLVPVPGLLKAGSWKGGERGSHRALMFPPGHRPGVSRPSSASFQDARLTPGRRPGVKAQCSVGPTPTAWEGKHRNPDQG